MIDRLLVLSKVNSKVDLISAVESPFASDFSSKKETPKNQTWGLFLSLMSFVFSLPQQRLLPGDPWALRKSRTQLRRLRKGP